MGKVKSFKGFLSLNYKNGKMVITKRKALKDGYWIPLQFNITVEVPNNEPQEINKHIVISETKAKEFFIEEL